ncbi:hypothetical protein MYRNA_25 [Mycobacterium phage Myrna]|uniref:Uncharacterized protein n=1 Tax=Mycobacterium phage Myrna TaxID=546805 RepID=B5LJ36_9CAUD|nr:gp25 [Mycobacterium phage Myrna]ACH62033.1 hypothetical protein MYRNA_25 [Mycobacterium phage Myrna]
MEERMNLTGVKVGDPIVIEKSEHRHSKDDRPLPVYEGKVTKVARKYFTVEYFISYGWSDDPTRGHTNEEQFEIATGRERPKNPDFTNYLDRAYTPEAWQEELYSREIRKKLREDHRFWGSSGNDGTVANLGKLTLLEQVELLAFLDRVKERQQKVDLDR